MFVIWPLASRDQLEAHLRASGVKDEHVIQCTLNIPIAEFRPWELQASPLFAAGVAEALQLTGVEKVLEIGTGTGYLTALLAILSRQLFTIEIDPVLAQIARHNLDVTHYGTNVNLVCADGSAGLTEHTPYDRICVSGCVPSVPEILLRQLADEGRMLIAVGSADQQELQLISKDGGGYRTKILGHGRLDLLRHK